MRADVTNALTRSFFEEWARTGYAGLSLERVARTAGVGKAALYRRWPDKVSMASDLLSHVGLTMTDVDAKLDKQAAVTQVTGWQAEPLDLLMQTSYTHIFSHVEWHMTAYYIRCRKTNKKWKWVTKESLDETYALPSAFRPFREQIENL
jgi:AcrR family transcriptional regulator